MKEKRPTVLVVDDEAPNRELISSLLEAEGYVVLVAASAVEAFTMLERAGPDVILLDVMMPGMTGIEVTEQLKADPELRKIPIAAITPLDDDLSRIAALDAGAEEFLTFPVQQHELASRIRNLVRLKRLRSDNEELQELVAAKSRAAMESEHFLRNTIDALSARIAIVDGTNTIVQANLPWSDRSDANGATGFDFVGREYMNAETAGRSEDSRRFAAGFERVRSGELPRYSQEYQGQCPGEEDHWFIGTITRFTDGAHLVVAHEDITERKTAEVRRAASEADYRTLVEMTPAHLMRVDRHGLIDFINSVADGFDMDTTPGTSLFDYIDPRDEPHVREELERVFRTGERGEYRARGPGDDGELRHYVTSLAPLIVGGACERVVVIALDITNEVLANQEKIAVAERLMLVLNNLPIAMFDSTLTDGVMQATWLSENIELVTAIPRDDWTSARWLGRVHEDDRALVEAKITAVETGAIGPLELRFDTDDGQRTFLVQGEQLGGGRLLGLTMNITNQRKLEHRTQQNQRLEAVGRLAGGVAHDFNNLLTAIVCFASFVRDGLPVGDPLGADIEEVLSAAQRATAVTRQLLVFSRQQSVSLQAVDMNKVIESLSTLLRGPLDANIEFDVQLGREPAMVFADASQLDQLIMNLVLNARDAMPTGGKLFIGLDHIKINSDSDAVGLAPGNYVRVTVSDTGEGMTEETRQHIFEPFFTTKGASTGTGLGLATCYGVVTRLGGTIDVASERGEGTTFSVLLPALTKNVLGVEPTDEPFDLRGTETVLVVEDEPALRLVAQRTLDEQGYTVLLAEDAYEAQEVFEAHADEIDLVFSDVVLTKGNGLDFANWVAAQRPDLVIILTSGYPERFALEDHSRFPVLWKPYTPTDLARRVRAAIAEDRARLNR